MAASAPEDPGRKRVMKNFLAAVLLIASSFCFAQDQAAVEAAQEELRAAFEADQASRRGATEPQDPCGDAARRLRVLELLGEGLITTPESKYYAALVLQHTPTFESVSVSAENYLIAHFLAKSAAESGYRPARSLAAVTIDKYLVSQGQPQKYGTHFTLNPETRYLEFAPVNPETTDEERREWGVPPISETMRRFEESGQSSRRIPESSERPRCSFDLKL